MPINLNNIKNMCWMRQIEIRLYSKIVNQKVVLGGTSDTQLNISIKGNKYLSALKDNGVITISNLTYAEITKLILGQFYKIEIWAGYRTTGMQCFFKGSVSFISDKIVARRDNETYILFASDMVAAYSQKRMNLTLNSGINLYAAFRYICLTTGIDSNQLPDSLKQEFLREVTQNYGTAATLVDQIAQNTGSFSIDTDNSIDGGGVVNCSDLSDKRQIKINPNTINFTKGNPTLDKDGLKICLLPTFCFKPGDIIIIDNSIIDVSISDPNQVASTFKSNYLDKNGAYMIIELDYNLENRGPTFEINVKARSLDIIKNIVGLGI